MSESVETGPSGKRSISDMLKNTMDTRQLSVSELAEFLERSPRMVRKLLSGESKGESFREAVEELADKGTVTATPERRRAKDGHVVPVRAKADEAPKRFDPKTGKELAPVKTPDRVPGGRYTDKLPEKYRSRKWATKHGDKRLRVAMPPGDKEATPRGMDNVRKFIRSTARSQAHKNKQVKIDVVLADGREMSLFAKGGFSASQLLRRANKEHGGDMDAFVRAQVAKVYPPKGAGSHKFASITIQTFNAATPKRR